MIRKIGGMVIEKDVEIEPNVIIKVKEGRIGRGSIIRSGARIEGTCVELGNEAYMDYNAWIGGGSCWDNCAYLKAGHWLHMGWNSHINIARGVDIGEEVGLGVETKVFTHGAYLPIDCGFPVQWGGVSIGNRVWAPNAWINPGVAIGNNVVIAAKSLVNKDIFDNTLVGGIPAEILKRGIYGEDYEKVNYQQVIKSQLYLNSSLSDIEIGEVLKVGETRFDVFARTIDGPCTKGTEVVRNQLRRNGIRFKYWSEKGEYVPWE